MYHHFYSFGFSTSSVNVWQAFGYVCNGTETTLSSCSLTGSVCAPRSNYAIAIECGGYVTGPGIFPIYFTVCNIVNACAECSSAQDNTWSAVKSVLYD